MDTPVENPISIAYGIFFIVWGGAGVVGAEGAAGL